MQSNCKSVYLDRFRDAPVRAWIRLQGVDCACVDSFRSKRLGDSCMMFFNVMGRRQVVLNGMGENVGALEGRWQSRAEKGVKDRYCVDVAEKCLGL